MRTATATIWFAVGLVFLCSLHCGAGSLTTRLEEEGMPDFPESAYIDPDEAPKVGPQPREPGSGEEKETEWGMGVNQREFRDDPRNTVVHCDGPDCPYAKATLQGSRDYKDSFFPVQEIEADKALIRHLMKSLHQPCKACAEDQEDVKNKKACESCRAVKAAKVKAVIDKVNALRRENAQAVKDDKEQNKGTPEQRKYTAPFNSTETLAAPADAYLDLNELHCSVSKHSRSVCSMCGGSVSYRLRGYKVEQMSPREQRFVPSYPFASAALQRRVRSVLRATAPDSVTTMSLAGHGEVTCVASSPAPSVASALQHLGVNMTEVGWTMRGMPPVGALAWTPTLTIRIDQRGRAEAAVPSAFREGGETAPPGPVQSVTVMFAMARQPWGGVTEIVPLMRLYDTVGEVAVWDPWGEGAAREVQQSVNGSMRFGGVDVPVVATQPAFGEWGTVTGRIEERVTVRGILEGFGCGAKEVRGGKARNCDPLATEGGPMRERMEALGLGEVAVTEGAVESSFEAAGEGRAVHRVEGAGSVLPQSRLAVAATFSTPRDGGGGKAMHWVWVLGMADGAELSAGALLGALMGAELSPRIAEMHLRDMAVVGAGSTVRAGEEGGQPSELLLEEFGGVQRGVSVRGRVVTGRPGAGGVSKLLEEVMGEGATVAVQGLVGWEETTMLGDAGDVALAGGLRLAGAVMRVTVRREAGKRAEGGSACSGEAGACEAMEAGLQGRLVVPIGALEAVEMEAYAGALPAEGDTPARLELVGSMEGTLEAVFGVAGMQLSFLVVRQRVLGRVVPRVIGEGVLSVGAACSVATMDVAAACMEGRAAVGFAPGEPSEGMLAGRVPALAVARLLRLAGVRDASWGNAVELLKGLRFRFGSSITYALREHLFKARGHPSEPLALYTVPAGMAGEGLATVEALGGLNCSMRWSIDLRGGRLRGEGELPVVSRGGLELTKGAGPFHGGAREGPVLKVVGVAGEAVEVWVQGFLSLGNLSSFALIRVDDLGMRGRVEGKFGGAGLHSAVEVRAEGGAPTEVEWEVTGQATDTGMAPVREGLEAAVAKECEKHQEFCDGDRAAEVTGKGWLELCGLSFGWKVPAGEQTAGVTPGAGGEVLLGAEVLAYGRRVRVHASTVLTDTAAATAAVGGAVFHALMGMELLSGDAGDQCGAPLPPRPFPLPAHAASLPPFRLPTAEVLSAAMAEDNAGAALEGRGASEYGAWSKRVAVERGACAVEAWEGRRQAWEWDESLRSDSAPGYVAPPFPQKRPKAGAPGKLRTDSFAAAEGGSGAAEAAGVARGQWRQGNAHGVGGWVAKSAKAVVGELEEEGGALLRAVGAAVGGGRSAGERARERRVARVASAYHELEHGPEEAEGGGWGRRLGVSSGAAAAVGGGWGRGGGRVERARGRSERVPVGGEGQRRGGERGGSLEMAERAEEKLEGLDRMAKRLQGRAKAMQAEDAAGGGRQGLVGLGRLEGELEERQKEVVAAVQLEHHLLWQ